MGQEEVVFEPVSGVVTFFKSVSTSSQSQHKYVDVDVDTSRSLFDIGGSLPARTSPVSNY